MSAEELRSIGDFVSPEIAAQIMCCNRYSLNLQAKKAAKEGKDRIGGVRFLFIGRNLKLCKADLLSYIGGSNNA